MSKQDIPIEQREAGEEAEEARRNKSSNLVSRLRNSWREDVVALCLKAADEIERLQMTIKRYEPVNTYDGLDIDQWRQRALAAERARSGTVETSDKLRLDWLTEVLVDTIYLDDGRIIDVGGNRERPHDIRFILDGSMKVMPLSIDDESSEKTNCVDSEGT